MSAPHIIDTYTVTDDVTVAYRVIVTGAVTDEASGLPLAVPFEATVVRSDLQPRALESLYAVAAYPERAFSVLPASFDIGFQARGYRPASVTINVPLSPVFPLPGPALALRAVPVRVQGRVVQKAGTHPPIPYAFVRVTTPGLYCARTSLHFAHAAGISIRDRALTPTGAAKTLVQDARGGAPRIVVNNTAGIAANTLLRLGMDLNAEYVVSTGLGAPGEVLLTGPLVRSFAAGAIVQRANRGAIGATRTLTRSADAGDGLLLCSGPLAAPTVEIVDGAATEYATLGALSDAAGYWALDGIGGAGLMEWTASAAAFSDLVVDFDLNYSQPVNILDFRLKP